MRLGWATLLHNWSVLLAAPLAPGDDAAVPEDRREEAALQVRCCFLCSSCRCAQHTSRRLDDRPALLPCAQVLSALVELGGSVPTDDPDALGRALQALAALLAGAKGPALKQIANDLGVPVRVASGCGQGRLRGQRPRLLITACCVARVALVAGCRRCCGACTTRQSPSSPPGGRCSRRRCASPACCSDATKGESGVGCRSPRAENDCKGTEAPYRDAARPGQCTNSPHGKQSRWPRHGTGSGGEARASNAQRSGCVLQLGTKRVRASSTVKVIMRGGPHASGVKG